MKEHLAAGGVVVKKDGESIKVLLIKDSYGRWTWPKGHTEGRETPEETALREISEETGLKDIKILESIGQQKYTYELDGEEILKIVHIFLVETTQEELIIQESEIAEGKWFSPEEAMGTIEYEGSREMLQKAIVLYKV